MGPDEDHGRAPRSAFASAQAMPGTAALSLSYIKYSVTRCDRTDEVHATCLTCTLTPSTH